MDENVWKLRYKLNGTIKLDLKETNGQTDVTQKRD
jgi:hypothetical protein